MDWANLGQPCLLVRPYHLNRERKKCRCPIMSSEAAEEKPKQDVQPEQEERETTSAEAVGSSEEEEKRSLLEEYEPRWVQSSSGLITNSFFSASSLYKIIDSSEGQIL